MPHGPNTWVAILDIDIHMCRLLRRDPGWLAELLLVLLLKLALILPARPISSCSRSRVHMLWLLPLSTLTLVGDRLLRMQLMWIPVIASHAIVQAQRLE